MSGDDEKPNLRVIEGAGQKRNRKEDAVALHLQDLAANLLRIAAGAGQAHAIERQVTELQLAFSEARAADRDGFGISDGRLRAWLDANDFEDFLKVGTERDQARWAADGTVDRLKAVNTILKGALRMAAARIRGNRMHESTAETILMQGVLDLEKADERFRSAYQPKKR